NHITGRVTPYQGRQTDRAGARRPQLRLKLKVQHEIPHYQVLPIATRYLALLPWGWHAQVYSSVEHQERFDPTTGQHWPAEPANQDVPQPPKSGSQIPPTPFPVGQSVRNETRRPALANWPIPVDDPHAEILHAR